MKNISQIGFGFVILVLCVSVATSQNTNSKRKSAKRSAAAQPKAEPMTEPVIISRAEDYPLDVGVLPLTISNAVKTADFEDRSSNERLISELNDRIKVLETRKEDDYDQKQKRLSLNLDILTKAEQRGESLRKQSFELIEKENAVRTKLDQIEIDLRPESIDRQIAFAGSLRPEDLRAARKKSLEAERTNQQNLLLEIQRTRTAVEANVLKSDILVERLRAKLEAEIDAALIDTPTKP
jgi:hypothetical protein